MMFFSDWDSLLRILVIGIGTYIGLILILRVSGNRTLAKMNSFDFIVTIALGSTFASAILDRNVAFLDSLLAVITLVALQYITTWIAVRNKHFNRLVKSEPVLLFWNGEYLRGPMKKAHVTEEEVQAGMREQGFSSTKQVGYVVLEANGKIIAVRSDENSTIDTL